MSSWVFAMDDDLEEEKIKLVKISGKPVLLIKKEGKVYAIDNACPHMGCPLKSGILDGYVLKCSCHNWGFDIRNGENVDTGEYIDVPDPKVDTFDVEVTEGKISVLL